VEKVIGARLASLNSTEGSQAPRATPSIPVQRPLFLFEITQFFSFKIVFGLADFLFNITKPLLAVSETFDKPFRVGAGERERYLLFHRSLLACCNQWSDLDFSAKAARPCSLKFLVKCVAAIPVPAEKSNQQFHGDRSHDIVMGRGAMQEPNMGGQHGSGPTLDQEGAFSFGGVAP
jgi:hypothetical protein